MSPTGRLQEITGEHSTSKGEVFGAHVAPGCFVRTTAEVLLALLPEWAFAREPDALTGYGELVVRAVDVANCDVKSGRVVRAKLGLKYANVADAVARARNSEKPAAKA